MKRKNRMLSLLLALAMVLTFMPTMAFATGEPPEDPEAKIGDVKYATLAEAVSHAEGDVTIELLKDVTLTDRVDVNRSSYKTTFDLDGYTIRPTATCGNGSAFNVVSGTVEIKNGTMDGTRVEEVNAVDDSHKVLIKDGICLITVRSGATLDLNDPNLTLKIKSKNGSCVYPFAGGTVNINDGLFINTTDEDYQYKAGFKAMTINQSNKTSQLITVKGGTFVGEDPAKGDDSGNPSTFLATGYVSYEGLYEDGDTQEEYVAYYVEEKALHDAKEAAWAELNSIDTSKYSGAELEAVEKAIEDGSNAIGNATTIEEVNAALADAKAAIAKQTTVADAKAAATAELDKVDPNKYSEPEKTAVANAIAAAKKDIAAAGTVAAVNAAKTAALNTIAAQPVLNEALPKVTAKKGTGFKKKLRARWKKLSKKNRKKISGYEVQYAKNANFTDSAKIVKAGKNNKVKTIKKLPRKQTYWVRVRTYKVTNGVKTVGAWSKVKKIKTK